MSTPQEPQETQLEQEQSSSLQEKHTQDTETEEEVTTKDEKQKTEDVEQKEEEEEPKEKKKVKTPAKAATPSAKKTPSQAASASKSTKENNEERRQEKVKTPAKTATPVANKTPSQATSVSKSATKRKFDAFHARNAAGEPTISEHEKNKKARASVLMKTPTTKSNGSAKKAPTKTREFSFARPTASSASRTAAAARDHAQAKAKPTPPPARKPLHPKRTPAKTERASMPTPKTVTDKASRPHFNYTPYTGPLPPLTVESSFAPKNSQALERGARMASPAPTKVAASRQKPKPTPGKENNGVNTDETTNVASTSKASRTPVKSSKSGSPLSKEENRSAFKEKIKSQRSVAQQAARSSPVSTSAATMETA